MFRCNQTLSVALCCLPALSAVLDNDCTSHIMCMTAHCVQETADEETIHARHDEQQRSRKHTLPPSPRHPCTQSAHQVPRQIPHRSTNMPHMVPDAQTIKSCNTYSTSHTPLAAPSRNIMSEQGESAFPSDTHFSTYPCRRNHYFLMPKECVRDLLKQPAGPCLAGASRLANPHAAQSSLRLCSLTASLLAAPAAGTATGTWRPATGTSAAAAPGRRPPRSQHTSCPSA